MRTIGLVKPKPPAPVKKPQQEKPAPQPKKADDNA